MNALDNSVIRNARHERAWAAYDGDAPKPLLLGPRREDDNVATGLARSLVDGMTSYLCGREVLIETDASTEGRTPQELALDALWPPEKRASQLPVMRTEGGVTGDVFLRVLPDRVVVLPSDAVTMTVDPLDHERVISFVVETRIPRGNGQHDILRQTHARADDGMSWVIRDEIVRAGSGAAQLLAVTPWPFDLPQIVHAQNRPSVWSYGEPDLTPEVLDLVAAIDRSLSNAQKMVRQHASVRPVTYGLDESGRKAFDEAPSGATIHMADRTGQALEIVEVSGSGLESAMRMTERLMRTFYAITGLPDPEAAADRMGDVSGVALELRFAGLIQRIEAMRRCYARLIVGVCDRLMLYNNLPPVAFRVVWPEVLPEDPDRRIARARELRDLGASQETVWLTAGLDPDVERERLDAERPADIATLLGGIVADTATP